MYTFKYYHTKFLIGPVYGSTIPIGIHLIIDYNEDDDPFYLLRLTKQGLKRLVIRKSRQSLIQRNKERRILEIKEEGKVNESQAKIRTGVRAHLKATKIRSVQRAR